MSKASTCNVAIACRTNDSFPAVSKKQKEGEKQIDLVHILASKLHGHQQATSHSYHNLKILCQKNITSSNFQGSFPGLSHQQLLPGPSLGTTPSVLVMLKQRTHSQALLCLEPAKVSLSHSESSGRASESLQGSACHLSSLHTPVFPTPFLTALPALRVQVTLLTASMLRVVGVLLIATPSAMNLCSHHHHHGLPYIL